MNLLTIEYLEKLKPSYEKKNFPIPKWITFSETLISLGWSVKLYRAKKTFSKYVTIRKDNQEYKVRFSNHKPIPIREEKGHCDFFVGVSNNQIITTEEVLKKILGDVEFQGNKMFANGTSVKEYKK